MKYRYASALTAAFILLLLVNLKNFAHMLRMDTIFWRDAGSNIANF